MFRMLAVAVNTFREAVRDRVLHGVLGLALAFLVFTLALAELALDQQRRVVLDLGLSSISLFSVIMSVFLGSSLLYKEIERKTLYVILPKPIRRHEFLLGKYFGIVLTVAVFVAIMGAVQLTVSTLQLAGPTVPLMAALPSLLGLLGVAMYFARDRSAVVVPWSALALAVMSSVAARAGVVLGPILAQLLLTLGEVLVLCAVALMFSAFSTPFLTALFTTGVWLVGRSADLMIQMKSKLLPELVRDFLRELVRVWPNFNLFVPGSHTLTATADVLGGPVAYLASSMAYAVLYSSLLLAAAAWVFRKRDFL
jgi:ABC-type transport system involved in multi-copper enzyme maturation permease subunit